MNGSDGWLGDSGSQQANESLNAVWRRWSRRGFVRGLAYFGLTMLSLGVLLATAAGFIDGDSIRGHLSVFAFIFLLIGLLLLGFVPVARRQFDQGATEVPEPLERDPGKGPEHSPVQLGGAASAWPAAAAAAQRLAGNGDQGPTIEVLKQERVYSRSIDLLNQMSDGDGTVIRILMSAEEDLASTGQGAPGAKAQSAGQEWIEELQGWLDAEKVNRKLLRIVAVPQKDFIRNLDIATQKLLQPFEKRRAEQWFLPDEDFSISIMLLGWRFALFGFPERAAPGETTAFQYAAVIQNRKLVEYLDSWFDNRFMRHPLAKQVMQDGVINVDRLGEFGLDPDPIP